jgi:hypothetical protein
MKRLSACTKRGCPFEAGPQLLDGHVLGDLERPHPVDLDLQQVEDVAVQDQLHAARLPVLAVVVLQQLGEALVVEEVLHRVGLAQLLAVGQVQVADDESRELHGSRR